MEYNDLKWEEKRRGYEKKKTVDEGDPGLLQLDDWAMT